jgi:DNA-binding beta-propeller fold protein YncE
MRTRFLLLTIVTLLLSVATFAAGPGYHIINTWKIGGDGGWDYLTADSEARRLYIARATRVMVVDLDSGKQVGEIPDTPGVHGVAIDHKRGKAYVSCGGDNSVVVFDITSLKTLNKIKVGQRPDAILFDPATDHVFTFNAGSQDSTVIDVTKDAVAGTIPLGGKPEFAATDLKGTVFVNMEDKNSLYAIDANKLTVKSKWVLPGCEEPSGLAIDRKNRRLFSGCEKIMAITDADSGQQVANAPVGDGVDAAAYDDETGLAFASAGGDAKLTVVQSQGSDKFAVVETPATQKGARTMALDTKTHNIYLVTAEFGPRPAPTAQNPHPRPAILPGTFVVLVLGK